MSVELPASRWSFGRVAKYLAVALLILIISYAAWLYWIFKGGVFSTSSFESVAWHAKQTNQTDMTCFRGGMANDIKKRILKPGVSRAVLERLLGAPDVKSTAALQYNLGMCSGFRIDFDSLNVYFNENGELTSVAIVQH